MGQLLKENERGCIYAEADSSGRKVIKRVIRSGCAEVYELLRDNPHPYIPKIYSVTSNEKEIVITEEYIDGWTISESCFTEKDLVNVAKELCKALSHIHRLGIVHRDIKPSNILMSDDGHIRLIDFDAARTVKPAVDTDTRYLGTKGFAPPEQYGYSQTDNRSDIFALGKTLECIFGRLAFDKKYKKIIDRCTRLDPEDRYSDADEVLKEFNGNKFAVLMTAAAFVTVLLVSSAAVILRDDHNNNLVPTVGTSAQSTAEITDFTAAFPTEITSESIYSVWESSAVTENSALSEATASTIPVTSEHTAVQSSETAAEQDITMTSAARFSESAVSVHHDPFSEYEEIYKNLDVDKAERLIAEEMDEPLLFKADDGIPMEYIIIDAASLKENKYAAMLFDYNNDGYDDLFQLSAYIQEGQNEYFRQLCVSVVKMYDGYPDFHVISDNTYFTSLISTSAMNQETGMLYDDQYVQLSVLDVNSDGYNDIVLSVGRCGSIINTQVFYYNNINLEYSSSGKLNLYLYCTEQMTCQGSDRFYVSDKDNSGNSQRIYSLSLEDTIDAFKYIDPNVFIYEKDDDSIYRKFQGITSR